MIVSGHYDRVCATCLSFDEWVPDWWVCAEGGCQVKAVAPFVNVLIGSGVESIGILILILMELGDESWCMFGCPQLRLSIKALTNEATVAWSGHAVQYIRDSHGGSRSKSRIRA